MALSALPLRRWGLLACAVAASTTTAANIPTRQAGVSACKVASNPSVDLSMGFGLAQDCAPSTGTLSAFMMFVDFPDAAATEASPEALRDFFLPAAADWYAESSYGALSLNVTADTSRFYRMPAAAASYGWDRGLSSEAHLKYIEDALGAYAGAAIAPADVLYIVATRSAQAISFSPTYMGEARKDGARVAGKVVTFGYDAYEAWRFLVLNHETGHTMCMPDYYPSDGRETGLWVGGWNLMGYINGPSPDYFAWDKWRLGWLRDEQVDCVAQAGRSTHVLTPLEVAGGMKAVVVKHNSTDVLVAELRSAQGLDKGSCAAGVLLYTVSTETPSGYGPAKVLDATPGSNGCADDVLNDATLTLDGQSSYTLEDWGVTVTVTEANDEQYTISVEVS